MKISRIISVFILLLVLLISSSSSQARSLNQDEYLIVQLSTDKASYSTGDDIFLSGQVSFSSTGEPAAFATVCLGVLIESTRHEDCAIADEEGRVSAVIAYITVIPEGYSGLVYVEASANYEELEGGAQEPVEYGGSGGDDNYDDDYDDDYDDPPTEQYLYLELWGPNAPVQIGGWEDIGIAGTVTSQGVNVDGALVTMKVAGQTFQTTTGTHTSGSFNWYWANNSFSAGDYWVEVTVTKDGYQSVTDSVPFTLIGADYDYWVTMDAIPTSLAPGNQVPFPGTLTLGGEPVSDWIDIYVTFPNGSTKGYSNLSDAGGRFTHTEPSLTEIGTYQLVVHLHADDKQISDVYTFTVGIPPTLAPAPPPSPAPEFLCAIYAVYDPLAFIGERVEVKGNVFCVEGDDGEPIFQEDWDVYVQGQAPYESDVMAPLVQTDGDGNFTAYLPVDYLYIQELLIIACNPEGDEQSREANPCAGADGFARWFGPLNVRVNIEPDITFSQTDYDQGEFAEGDLSLNPSNFVRDWDDGVEIIYQILGPVGGVEKQYLIESPYSSFSTVGGVRITTDGANPFRWAIPHDAGAGKYIVTAYISGKNIATQTVEGDFYITDIRHTNLTAIVEPPPDDWSSASLMGQYTDSDGVPLAGADVRVEFLFMEWNDAGDKIVGTREFTLAGTTDTFGNYEINLEPLDIFSGQGQADPWKDRIWYTTVFADKEGYATGATDLQIKTPTVSPRLTIISVDPPLDYLSNLANSGLSYEELTDMDIKVQVRYNNIFGKGAKLSVSATGFWATDCRDAEEDWLTYNPHLSINGNRMPEWDVYPFVGGNAQQNTNSWAISGMHHVPFYSYPKHEVKMPAQQGIDQVSTFSVAGKLFGYRYSENSPNQCGNQAFGSNSPLVPPPWVGARTAVHISVSLGSSSAVANYNINPPSISAKGAAWVSPTGGEFKGSMGIGNASGFALAHQTVDLSSVTVDIGIAKISADTENPTDEITIQASAKTDEKGELNLALTSKTNPCLLEKKAKYFVKITSSAIDGEKYIPIELRCVEELNFEFSEISVVQVVDLTNINNDPIKLVAGKEAGVRVQMLVDGEIYQPENRPVQFTIKFEMLAFGIVPLSSQTKTVSLSEKGVSVAGMAEALSFDDKSSGVRGAEVIFVDFIFEPSDFGLTEVDYDIRITVDPDEVYGEKLSHKKPVTVKKMKTIHLMIVPVDIPSLDMGFVLKQTQFLLESYPLGTGNMVLYPNDSFDSWWFPPGICDSFWHFKEIACKINILYGSGGNANNMTKIVGIIDNATWLKGLFVTAQSMGAWSYKWYDLASMRNVVLTRYPDNVSYTTAHEIAHTFGVELSEQYKDHPPNGLPVTGLILRNGQIFNTSDVVGPADQSSRKILKSAGFEPVFTEMYDFMGNSGYYYDDANNQIMWSQEQGAWTIKETWDALFDALEDPPDEEIFYIQSVIGVDGLVTLNPVVLMDGVPDEASTDGEYELQILSSSQEVLHSTRFGSASKPGLVNLYVPYAAGVGQIVVLRDGMIVGELQRSPSPPELNLLAPSLDTNNEDMLNVSWAGSDPDGDSLTYSLHYSCDETTVWMPLAANLESSSYQINLANIAGGTCALKVTASDGINSTYALTDFQSPLKMPTVEILTDKTTFDANESIFLEGAAFTLSDGLLPKENLIWFSDIDGELGVGNAISVMLSPGTHHLTLRAQDMDGNAAIAERVFTVQGESSISLNTTNLLYTIGGGVFLILLVVTIFAIFIRRKQRQPKLQGPQQKFQTDGQAGTVQDQQGNWWYQDPDSGIWQIWNGQAWEIAQLDLAIPPPPPSQPFEAKPKGKGCLLSVIVVCIMSALVIGGFTLVAFGFFPALIIPPASRVSIIELLKIGGGGLLLTLFGTLLLRGGFKSIATRRAIVEDEFGQRREKRGCSAILNGFGRVFLGLILLIAGLGWIAMALYQQLIPLLGYTLV